MKKLFTLFAGLMLAFTAQAAKFSEGDHYTVLAQEKSKSPEVTEFFSFYCPHCYQFEGIFQKLKQELPANIKVQKAHVAFMGGDMGVPVAKAYATMALLKAENTMSPVLFRQIQERKQPPRTEAELRQLFTDNGIDGAKFDSVYNSFVADSMQRRYDQMFRDAGLRGVPAVVVNNKYVVKTGKIQSLDEYIELVKYLTTL